jgi:hypothetical protein
LNKRILYAGMALTMAFMSKVVYARDLGVLVLPIHQGKFTSSLMYEHLKLQDDFDNRGRVDFKSSVVGASFSYGLTDQIAVAVKGGNLIDPRVETQGDAYESRAGYLYGIDLYNEVFPATPGWKPGIQLSGGVTGFQLPFDRFISGGTTTPIDQKESGLEFHGAVVATFKVGPTEPYAGVRGFGSSINWQDNSPAAGAPDHITGHAHGNISLVAGLPVQISKEVRFTVEGRFVNETAVTAGFTIAAF